MKVVETSRKGKHQTFARVGVISPFQVDQKTGCRVLYSGIRLCVLPSEFLAHGAVSIICFLTKSS